MNDHIIGRPIRCNRQKLEVKRGKNYAEVLFIGDTHVGSPQFDQTRLLNMVDYAKKNSIYVFLMGDLIEMATRHSIGAGVYEQTSTGQSQFEQVCEWLKPLSDKKLILGTHRGNHEARCYELTGVDISKAIARELSVPYLGDACWSTFSVGKEKYSIYSLHGRSGARFDGTALLALERLAVSFAADLVAQGHTHKAISSNILYQKTVNGVVKEFKKFLLITGSYLKYDGGLVTTVAPI
jgi:UDP-2,3-diacylglucosamine pyrophosphatase LpxH